MIDIFGINLDANLIILAIIGMLNAYTAHLSWKTNRNILTLEKNTNSIKDALVASTAKASLAEGTAAGLEQGRSENNNKR
jgi:hypothetical protein